MVDGLTDQAKAYIQSAVADMTAAGVTVTLADEDGNAYGGKLGGYFDEDGPTFFVAKAVSPHVWLSVFVHEYQHYRQWRANSPTWTARLGGDCCAWYVFDAWLQGVVELTPQQRDDAILVILECERECETMVLAELAANPGLGLSLDWYHRAANVYLAWYGVCRLTRQWYQRSPYADDNLVSLMPGDRLLAIDEAIRPTPSVLGAITAKVFSDVA
jgi:hypothetical protein